MPKTLHPCPFCRSQLPRGTYYCLHCRSQLDGRPVESFEGAFLGPPRPVFPVSNSILIEKEKGPIINYREDLDLSAWWCHRLAKVLYIAGSGAFLFLVTALAYPDYELHISITRPLGLEPGFFWMGRRADSDGPGEDLFVALFMAALLWFCLAFVVRLVYYQVFLYVVFGPPAARDASIVDARDTGSSRPHPGNVGVTSSGFAPVPHFSASPQAQPPSESTPTDSHGVHLGVRNRYSSWALGVGVLTIFLWQFSIFPLATIGLSVAGINHAPKVGNKGRAQAWVSLALGVVFLFVYLALTTRTR